MDSDNQRLDEIRQLVQTAFRAGMLHAVLSLTEEDLKQPLPGVVRRSLSGEAAYLDRLVDELVQRIEPVTPATANMRERLMAEWTKTIRLDYRKPAGRDATRPMKPAARFPAIGARVRAVEQFDMEAYGDYVGLVGVVVEQDQEGEVVMVRFDKRTREWKQRPAGVEDQLWFSPEEIEII